MTNQRARAVELSARFIKRGAEDAEALEWFRTALAAHRRAKGAVSFETCAHLPVSAAGWDIVLRDNALRHAADEVCLSTPPRARAEELRAALSRALHRGIYARWRAAGDSREPNALLGVIERHGDDVPSLSTIRRALEFGS